MVYPAASIGAPYDPRQARIGRNRRRRDQATQIFAARRNVADLQNTGMRQTLQSSEDYKYGLAGVAQPASIRLPQGADTSRLSPLVRPAIRTQADYLSEQFEEENTLADYDDEHAQLTAPRYNPTATAARMHAPNTPASQPMGQLKLGGGPTGHVQYTDLLGQTSWLRPGDAAIAKAKDQMQLDQRLANETASPTTPEEMEKQEEARMKRDGFVLYRDPVSRQKEWLSPFDAALRKSGDEDRLSAAIKSRKPDDKGDFDKTGASLLVKASVAGMVDPQQVYLALRKKGYTDAEIDLLYKIAQADDEEEGSAE